MNIVRCFVIFVMFAVASITTAQEVLVDRAPEYPAGEGMTFTFETILGSIEVEITSKGLVKRHNGIWTQFDVVARRDGRTFFEGPAFQQEGQWNGHLTFKGKMYRSYSQISFPLREGATFTNYLMAQGPCSADRSQTCMNVTMQEHCHSVRRVSEGISLQCDGPGGRIHYVMDENFRWPVSFEVLN